jgi:hypothetical protein
MKIENNQKFRALLPYLTLAALFLVSLRALPQDIRQTEARMMKQAEENIEKFRKGNVTIQFKTQDGEGIKNARVDIRPSSRSTGGRSPTGISGCRAEAS